MSLQLGNLGKTIIIFFKWPFSWKNQFPVLKNDLFSSVNCSYYSFKIFPQFRLAKSTRIIHHNQLLITRFGRILCLTRKLRQKCSILAG